MLRGCLSVIAILHEHKALTDRLNLTDITKEFVCPCAQLREGEGGRPPLPFFENQNKGPDFGKKCPDCVHP